MIRIPRPRFRRFTAGLLTSTLWLVLNTAAAPASSPRSSTLSAAATTSTANLAAEIDGRISQPRFAAASWGIAVTSLDTGRTLYAHRADQLMQPASTAKLFTAALTLSTLGVDYRIPTRLLGHDEVHDGRLNGPLILYGMGDPTLGTATSADWAIQLANQLFARGVR
jgi:D-alanyl-D-alanine carboxypeptidase/D-alanyl-D-alanine-endopeptidase (penicillin-binding protein 4)